MSDTENEMSDFDPTEDADDEDEEEEEDETGTRQRTGGAFGRGGGGAPPKKKKRAGNESHAYVDGRDPSRHGELRRGGTCTWKCKVNVRIVDANVGPLSYHTPVHTQRQHGVVANDYYANAQLR